MRVLVSGQTAYLREIVRTKLAQAHLGVLLQPNQHNDIRSLLSMNLPLAIDNANFSNPNFNKLWNLLIEGWEIYPWISWLTVPDVVADAAATLSWFDGFIAELECEVGQVPPVPLAFVGQDGLERPELRRRIPWDQFACFFVGGSTRWKLGPHAVDLCDEAKRRGKLIHVGRVNSIKRALYCRDVLKADSVDGTGFSRFARSTLMPVLEAIADRPRPESLFDADPPKPRKGRRAA
jgi:hypothetical protein